MVATGIIVVTIRLKLHVVQKQLYLQVTPHVLSINPVTKRYTQR